MMEIAQFSDLPHKVVKIVLEICLESSDIVEIKVLTRLCTDK